MVANYWARCPLRRDHTGFDSRRVQFFFPLDNFILFLSISFFVYIFPPLPSYISKDSTAFSAMKRSKEIINSVRLSCKRCPAGWFSVLFYFLKSHSPAVNFSVRFFYFKHIKRAKLTSPPLSFYLFHLSFPFHLSDFPCYCWKSLHQGR